jgi:two-component system cell cycle response regulator DivK
MAKILLIEDNEMNRDMLSRRLNRRGFEVLLAVDGESGINVAVQGQPDLILMDMGLPFISGWDATVELKKMDATRTIPIIALTAHALASDQARALSVGCDDFDTKPVDLTRLLSKIDVLLGTRTKSGGA